MASSLPCLLSSTTTTTSPSKITFSSSTISTSSTETTENSCRIYNQADAFRIYQNKTIVFFGDSTMRSIYCDLSRLLHSGKMLNNAETKRYFRNHALYINETILQSYNKRALRDRIDCRRFDCKASSTVLFLIHVGSIIGTACPVNVQWLKQITQDIPIDLVVMSCAYKDLCDRELAQANEQFDKKLPLFQSNLSIICSIFKLAFPQSIMIWLPPLPSICLRAPSPLFIDKKF